MRHLTGLERHLERSGGTLNPIQRYVGPNERRLE